MIDDLKFVQGAVAKKDLAPELTHFQIKDGRITGYNGHIALSSPINLKLDVVPRAVPLIKAIQSCKETVQINLTPKGRLSIKSGPFKAFVECLEEKEFPDLTPKGETIELDGKLIEHFKLLEPFIAEDASRKWARGILLNGYSAFATNNIVLIEVWLGYHFPFAVNIPHSAIKELIRIKQEPTSIQLDESIITFHFSEGRWLKTQVYTTEWPDLTKILDNPAQPVPCGTDFYDNCEQLIPFTDEHDAVYFNGEELSTSKHDEQGARFATENIPTEGAFNLTQLLKLKGVAKTIDFSLYPAPVLFFGDNIRGAIIGQRI